MLKQFENKSAAADLPAARVALANAIAKAKRHERHRAEDRGRKCYWCDVAESELAEARAAVARLARLEGPDVA